MVIDVDLFQLVVDHALESFLESLFEDRHLPILGLLGNIGSLGSLDLLKLILDELNLRQCHGLAMVFLSLINFKLN